MDVIEQIRQELDLARPERRLSATFHALVLVNADALRDVDPGDFCRQVGVQEVWAREFRKMLAAAGVLRDKGYEITR